MILLLALILLVLYLIPTYKKPVVIQNLITDEEKNYIIRKAEEKLKPSEVSDENTVDTRVRKSETAWLDIDDPVISQIAEKCLKFTDRPMVNCETMQVVKYKPGGYYKPHYDTLNDDNPRLYTFLIALNDDYEGGETEFPNLKNSFKMNSCDGLLFYTTDNYELVTSKALHGGRPVKSGEKWICNLWVRKYAYNS